MVTVVTVTTARGNHASVATLVAAWTGTSRRETGTQAEEKQAEPAKARSRAPRGGASRSRASRHNNNKQHSARRSSGDHEAAGIAAQGAILPRVTNHPKVGTKSPVSVQSETTPRDLNFAPKVNGEEPGPKGTSVQVPPGGMGHFG